MCVLCSLDPVNAFNGAHEAVAASGDGFQPAYAQEPDGDLDYGASDFTYHVGAPGSGDQNIDGLLSGYVWTDAELTFSFPDSIDDYDYGADDHAGLSEFSAQQKAAAYAWIANVEAVSGVTLTELDGADGALDADAEAQLKFVNSQDPATAYAYYPYFSSVGGDMFFNRSGDFPDRGDYDWATVGHELGHALGLSHGHTDNGGFGAMEADRDSLEFTIMTYRSYVGDPLNGGYSNGSTDYPQTLMMYDIATLQFLYGANFNHRAGDNVYSFDAGGEMFVDGAGQGDPIGSEIFLTIWDGGGEDTYDFSNFANDLLIDLSPGGWVDLDVGGFAQRANLGDGNHARGHVFNALQFQGDARSLIENAVGGDGDDSVVGNAAGNLLAGGAGSDTLTGGAGDDEIQGGDGADFAAFLLDYAAYAFDAVENAITVVGEGFDTVWNDVETFLFADFSITFDDLLDEISSGATQPPQAAPDAIAALEDAPVSGSLFADNGFGPDIDPDGDALTLVSVNGDTSGLLTLASGAFLTFSADGQFTFDPNGAYEALAVGETAVETLTYVVTDGFDGEDSATVTITIAGANDGPVARNDLVATTEDGGLAGDLLADNGAGADGDVDGDALSVIGLDGGGLSATLASGAVVSADAGGALTVAPNGAYDALRAGEIFEETFTYAISDGAGVVDAATVTLRITGVNDAPLVGPAAFSGDEDQVIAGAILATDPEGDAPTFALLSGPSHGALSLEEDGSFSFAPDADYNGADAFTFTVADADGAVVTATATLSIAAVNDAPLASAAAFATPEDQAISGVLAGTDVDGDALTFSLASGAAGGVVSIAADGGFTYTPDADFNGLDSFTYRVTDAAGASGEATVSIDVAPVNDAPVAESAAAVADEDSAVSGVLVAADVDGDALTFAVAEGGGPENGVIEIDASGGYVYTPDADYFGADAVTFTVADPAGAVSVATLSITVDPVADAPVATDGAFLGDEDAQIAGLLTATDADGDGLSFALGAGPANGVVELAPDGSFVYAPDADYFGADVFTVIVSDPGGLTDTAEVSLSIASVNDAPIAADSVAAGEEDTAVAGQLFASDVETAALAYALAAGGGPANGVVEIGPDGAFTYTPDADFNGADEFTWTATDADGASVAASISLTIAAVNDAPVAEAAAIETEEDVAVSGQLAASDVETADLVFAQAAGGAPTRGAVEIAADGGFVYTPGANLNGPDAFTFTATDAEGAVATATVTVNVAAVNDLPAAAAAAFATSEDQTVTGQLTASDVEPGALTFSLGAAPALGAVEIAADGAFTYTPGANLFGDDGFTFVVTDADGGSATASVSLSIAAVNDAPAAENAVRYTQEDQVVSGQLAASDVEPGALTFALAPGAGPLSGAVEIAADGAYVFTPDADFNGIDGFSFIVTDSEGATDRADVTLVIEGVNDAPAAEAQEIETDEDSPVSGQLSAEDVDSGALTFALLDAPANGVAAVAPDGAFTYTPAPDFNGEDAFTYSVSDGAGATDTATVLVSVAAVNDAPVAASAVRYTDEDRAAAGQLSATDVETDTLAYALAEGGGPLHGVVEVAPEGGYLYTPGADYHGEDAFTWIATDAEGATAVATLSLVIRSVNDAPVASPGAAGGDEDGAIVGQLTATDVEPGALIFALAVGGAPAHGVVEVAADGGYVYTPDADFHGTDGFTFTVTDAGGLSASATVGLTIAPVNDAPVAAAAAFAVAEDGSLAAALSATDVEPGALSYTLLRAPAHGVVEIAPDGGFSYAPAADFAGEDDFAFRVEDAEGAADEAEITLTVTPVNDAPVAIGASFEGQEDAAIAGVLAASDVEPGALTFRLVEGPAAGTADVAPDGAFVYTPDPDANGDDAFVFEVEDAGGLTSRATVSLSVAAVNDAPIAQPAAFETEEDSPLNGVLAGIDVETADLVFALAEAPALGTVDIAADGAFTYTPDPDANGADSFTFSVTDADGAADTATATISILAVNDAPVAQDDRFAGFATAVLTGALLTGPGADTDVDGDALFVSAIDGAAASAGDTVTLPSGARLTLSPDGAFAYDPAGAFDHLLDGAAAQDGFSYTVSDGAGGADTADVVIDVIGAPLSLSGGAADDAMTGGPNDDTLDGGEGGDTIAGLAGNDQMAGAGGDDVMSGAAGADTLDGGAGADSLLGQGGGDLLRGGGGGDTLKGGIGRDLLEGGVGADLLLGGGGGDTLIGGGGRDTLDGGGGRDLLQGGGGRDLLLGARGRETLEGGAGADKFHFTTLRGKKTVTDFGRGADRVEIDGVGAFADLEIRQQGADALVFADRLKIVLEDTLAEDLSPDDFLF